MILLIPVDYVRHCLERNQSWEPKLLLHGSAVSMGTCSRRLTRSISSFCTVLVVSMYISNFGLSRVYVLLYIAHDSVRVCV